MTKYEIFERIWLCSIVLFITLLILVGIGKVGHNDLRNELGDEDFVHNSFAGFEWED